MVDVRLAGFAQTQVTKRDNVQLKTPIVLNVVKGVIWQQPATIKETMMVAVQGVADLIMMHLNVIGLTINS